jgi:hypothetical protein
MISNVEANSRPQKICLPTLLTRYRTATRITHDDIAELEGLMLGRDIHLKHREGRKDTGTHGKQGLHKLAHNATEDEAYEDREHHWTMAPKPYPSVFPLENPDRHESNGRDIKNTSSLFDIENKVEDPGGNSQAEEV